MMQEWFNFGEVSMKLAQALMQRADAKKRLEQLRQRLIRSAKVQEGDAAPENPQDLLSEMDGLVDELTSLIQRINRTNSSTAFDSNRSLTDILAERDALMMRRSMLSSMMIAAQPQARYGRMEIKETPTVSIAEMQKQYDELARQHRELDTAIQQMNWTVDLL
jgi:hypothetical protein